jgi:hypothetical protein
MVGTNALQDDQALRQTSVELIVPGGDVDIVPGVIRPSIEQLALKFPVPPRTRSGTYPRE